MYYILLVTTIAYQHDREWKRRRLNLRTQYAFLQINIIDNQCHPFSIASGPDSFHLEFYIEVQADHNSSTDKLWKMSKKNQPEGGDGNEYGYGNTLLLHIDVMGPYGTSLATLDDFSHALAIGAGTGKSFFVLLFLPFDEHCSSNFLCSSNFFAATCTIRFVSFPFFSRKHANYWMRTFC